MPQGVKGIRADAVTDWLCVAVPGLRAPLEFTPIVGGHSNLTYTVTDAAGRRVVLRRPPVGAVLATAHDMGREHRIISALAVTEVPVAPALALCTDDGVNDAPFYVMDFVDGLVPADGPTVKEHLDIDARRALAERLIDVLVALHKVDPDSVGLGDLGRREAYLARQLKRWSTQWEKTKTREFPAMEELAFALGNHMPEQGPAAIVHGDYRLGNMLVGSDGRLEAVLDWELCTLGDPLADLGYLLNDWAEPGEKGLASGVAFSPSGVGGFPSRAEVLRRYAEGSGRDVSGIAYYRAFQYWRMAAIIEGVLARYLKGVMGEGGDVDLFRAQVDALALAGLELANSL